MNGGLLGDSRLISEELLLETRSPQIIVPRDANAKELGPFTNFQMYGLGWGCCDYRGHSVQEHGGYLNGFRSQVALIPELKIGMAILSNLTPSSLPEALRNTLMDIALGLPEHDWDSLFIKKHEQALAEAKAKEAERDDKRHKDTRPSLPIEAYNGLYKNSVFGETKVSLVEEMLRFKWGHIDEELSHFHFDTFKLEKKWPRVNELLHFSLNEKAEVTGLTVMGFEFKKVTADSAETGDKT